MRSPVLEAGEHRPARGWRPAMPSSSLAAKAGRGSLPRSVGKLRSVGEELCGESGRMTRQCRREFEEILDVGRDEEVSVYRSAGGVMLVPVVSVRAAGRRRSSSWPAVLP